MAISDNYVPVKTLGNGVTTAFSGSWAVIAASYIRVYLENVTTGVQTLQTVTTDYTLDFDDAGFTVTFLTAPTSANYVVIARNTALSQTDPYTTSKGFQGDVIENSFDKLTAMVQDNREILDRVPKFALGTDFGEISLPEPDAGKLLQWNADEDGLENSTDTISDIDALATAADASADAAALSEAAASASAVTAVAAAAEVAGLSGTSVTSNTIGTGSTSFTTQAGKSFASGRHLLITSDADPANRMSGYVTAYSGTSLTVLVEKASGSGIHTDWTIRIDGEIGSTGSTGSTGATGATGPAGSGSGDVLGPATSADTSISVFDGTNNKTIKASAVKIDSSANMTAVNSITVNTAGLHLFDTDASHDLIITVGSNLTADRVLTITTGDAARTLDISAGSVTITAAGASILDDANVGAIRTTLGVGTGDSPQFTAINLGAATDTTITRVSAGVIAVEGSNVLLASGLGSVTQAYDATLTALGGTLTAANKIPYATALNTASELTLDTDGTLAANSDVTLASQKAVKTYVDAHAGGLTAAAQSDQETATSITTAVTPGRQQYHPSAAKFYCNTSGTSSPAVAASYNVTSRTDNGVGDLTITIAIDFSSVNYCAVATVGRTGAAGNFVSNSEADITAGLWRGNCFDPGGVAADPEGWHVVGFGDQ